jgi:internalin A
MKEALRSAAEAPNVGRDASTTSPRGESVQPGFAIEQGPAGATLTVTGPWSDAAAQALRGGMADGLVLNYAKGFGEPTLDFLEPWPLRRLDIIARWIPSAAPIARVSETLESLSIQLKPRVRIDLSPFGCLGRLFIQWSAIKSGTLPGASQLTDLGLMWFQGSDLSALGGLVGLRFVRLAMAPKLTSVSGLQGKPIETLWIQRAGRLADIDALAGVAGTITELRLEGCPQVGRLNALAGLARLTNLELGDCGVVESLAPLDSLDGLRELHLWGTTKVGDGDRTLVERLKAAGARPTSAST